MKHIKLFEEFVNEGKPSLSVEKALKAFKKKYPNGSERELADYVDDNWKKLTGAPNSQKDEERMFPDEVEEMIDELELDYDEFSQEWNMVRGG